MNAPDVIHKIRLLHQKTRRTMFGQMICYCKECDLPWPCHTRRLTDIWQTKNTTPNASPASQESQ